MPTHSLATVRSLIEVAFAELGCTVPVVEDGDDLVVRDLIIFESDEDIMVVEASNAERPILTVPKSEVSEVASTVALLTAKGIILRAINRNS